jgi:hypothetical protein
MLWKLFDTHFVEIIEKFEIYSELYRELMQTTSIVMALDFYGRWRNQMAHMELYMEQMRGGQESHKQTDKRTMGECIRNPAREYSTETPKDATVEDLQRRIAAPAWATTFEHARSHRIDESGDWLLSHPLLTKFTQGGRDTNCTRLANVLFIYDTYCLGSVYL